MPVSQPCLDNSYPAGEEMRNINLRYLNYILKQKYTCRPSGTLEEEGLIFLSIWLCCRRAADIFLCDLAWGQPMPLQKALKFGVGSLSKAIKEKKSVNSLRRERGWHEEK